MEALALGAAKAAAGAILPLLKNKLLGKEYGEATEAVCTVGRL